MEKSTMNKLSEFLQSEFLQSDSYSDNYHPNLQKFNTQKTATIFSSYYFHLLEILYYPLILAFFHSTLCLCNLSKLYLDVIHLFALI